MFDCRAIVIEEPERIALRQVALAAPSDDAVVVEVEASGVSTGTEKLLFTGAMPAFPGMGYPLVPGYEAVGRIVAAEGEAESRIGEMVFVPGAHCFEGVRGLFGANASRLVIPERRAVAIGEGLGERGTLLALAATARHAITVAGGVPDLIVGHGVLGRLVARIAVAEGGAPVVWEVNQARMAGAAGYEVREPSATDGGDYRRVIDASGDTTIIDSLIPHIAKGATVTLAGFYPGRVGFAFAPAFMRELRLAIAAEWQRADLDAVLVLIAEDRLSLDGLITHRAPAGAARDAYRTAFDDPDCLKLVIDWGART